MQRHASPYFYLLLGVLALVGPSRMLRAEAPPTPAQEQFFEGKIRPLLVSKCQECHGVKKQEGGLRLDSRAALLQGGDSGEAVAVPGNAEASRLLRAVRRQGDLKMPPAEKDKLAEAEVGLLTEWIKQGLPWPAAAQVASVSQADLHAQTRARHWSLQPIVRPALPVVANTAWVNSPVDAYILARLEAAGLAPAPAADRATFIRRVSFDLLGLPPTPEEVLAFESDTRPDAFEQLVDRLLASPRYGERWGRHWLDVARYSDTRGYAFQRERKFPYAYTYRDYVIRALNADKPYNTFFVEQLAADKLPPTADRSALAALGFLTVGRKFDNQADDMDEQIDTVSRGLLGLTVGCARCHDHKFDPIPTEDYYSLYGVFASTQPPADLPTLGDPSDTAGYTAFQAELAKRKDAVESYLAERRVVLLETSRSRVTDYLVRVVSRMPESLLAKLPFLSLGENDLKPKLVERWRQFFREHAQPTDAFYGPWTELVALADDEFEAKAPALLAKWQALPAGLGAGQVHPLLKASLASGEPIKSKVDIAQRYGKLWQDAYALWKQAGANDAALGKLSAEVQPLARALLEPGTPTHITRAEFTNYLNRAEQEKYRDLKKLVEEFEATAPGAPPRAMSVEDKSNLVNPRVFIRGNANRPGKEVPRQFLKVIAGEGRQPFTQGSGRLELAQAIVAPENTLTARVLANRAWMHLFGQPLVSTPSDFGLRSSPPTHPELLNYLAWRLRELGWSMKAWQRELVLSSTYRQSARAALPAGGGRSASEVDPENLLLSHMHRKRLEFEPLRDALYAVAGNLQYSMYGRGGESTKAGFQRRAVYGFIDRQDLPNLLRVFDFASPDSSSPGRPRTIVPQQALFFMNSPVVIEQAQRLSARPDVAGLPDASQRISRLYLLLYARPPQPAELQLGLEFIASSTAQMGPAVQLGPWEQYAQLLLLASEFMYVD